MVFNASKALSAIRLKRIVDQLELKLDLREHLRLCYVGMLYSNLLPGNIGGDGYKGFTLKRSSHLSTHQVIASLALDRGSGLLALILLAAAFFLLSPISLFLHQELWLILGILVIIVAYDLAIRKIFPTVSMSRYQALRDSIGVQGLQAISAYFALLSFPNSQDVTSYITLFLISSVAATLPLTIGGIGIRELVSGSLAAYLGINVQTAVLMAFALFVIAGLSSLLGLFGAAEYRIGPQPLSNSSG